MNEPFKKDWALALLGAIAVAGNILGVVALQGFTRPYRLSGLDGWVRDTLTHPPQAVLSSMAFVVGLASLSIWAWELAERLPEGTGRLGCKFVCLGAALDAEACFAP